MFYIARITLDYISMFNRHVMPQIASICGNMAASTVPSNGIKQCLLNMQPMQQAYGCNFYCRITQGTYSVGSVKNTKNSMKVFVVFLACSSNFKICSEELNADSWHEPLP